MTKTEVLDFLNANPVCFLATVDNGAPRVRGMMLYRADEQGILFHTGKGRDMVTQMEENPAVEICSFEPNSRTQVRVSGTAEFIDDLALKQEIVATRDFLKPIAEQFGYENFIVFRLKDCKATVWTMAENTAPKTYIDL